MSDKLLPFNFQKYIIFVFYLSMKIIFPYIFNLCHDGLENIKSEG